MRGISQIGGRSMGKLKLVVVFVAAAILSGSLTLAPKVHAWWKQVHPISCVPYAMGYGFYSPTAGDMHIDEYGVSNTSDRNIDLICPGMMDDRTFPAED